MPTFIVNGESYDIYAQAIYALEKLGSGVIEYVKDGVLIDEIPLEDVDHYRQCSICGSLMGAGYLVTGGYYYQYYCSDECLHQVHSAETYSIMYGEGTAFWTEWD